MTKQQHDNELNSIVSKHVASKCATYAGGGMCLLDRPCPFFTEEEGARCGYYERAVLPEDDKLKARYWARFGLAYWNTGSVKTCKECGRGYESSSNAQKYCNDCTSEIKRRQKSAQNRKYYRERKFKGEN